MPFTLPLRAVPLFPKSHSVIVNADGTPSKEFVTFLDDMKAWAERVQAALTELEP
jgi:hypothetical protein